MNQLTSGNTMTSSALAEMLGKQKKHINESIKNMFSDKIDGQIIRPSIDARGYVIDYHLPELESKMFVAKHDITYLETITQFWIDGNEAPRLPSTKELALMVIKSEEEKEQAMIEVDRLQGVCNTITAQFATGMTAVKFCKQLNGVSVNQVNKALKSLNMLQNSKEGLIPTSYSRDKYFKITYVDYVNKDSEREGQSAKTTLTMKGAKWLYRAYLSGKLPMKATWDNVNSHVVFQ